MRNSVESNSEIKNISGRRSIRNNEELSSNNKIVNNNDDSRSISEPPQSYSMYKTSFSSVTATTSNSRLKPIREKISSGMENEEQGSSDEEDDLSKSNSQLNESDLDLEIPDSVSQTPTPTPLGSGSARRINSETNLNDSKRRMTGFLGNRSKRFCASTSELSFTAHLDTRKSLFSPKNNHRSLSRSSLYGSATSLNSTNSRLFMNNSPFYNGKTMFGGASAYPKRDINSQHKVLRTPVQMRPSSSLSNSSVTSTKSEGVLPESSAAKRILDIMNQFNGPLKEARSMGGNITSKINLPGLVQNQRRFGEEDLVLDRSINLSRQTAPYGRPIGSSASSMLSGRDRSELSLIAASVSNPKPLQIPTMTQLLKMKRLQNNTERVREIANRSHSFLNQMQDYKLPNNNDAQQNKNSNYGINAAVTSNNNIMSAGSSSLKMKNNFTKNLLRNDKGFGLDQLPPAPLNLPNVQLPQLKSIPKFDIQLPAAVTNNINNNSSKSTSPLQLSPKVTTSSFMNFKTSTTTTTTAAAVATAVVHKNDFNFSKPLKLSSSDFDMKKLNFVTECFIFSKPSAIISSENVALKVDEGALSQKQTTVTKSLSSFSSSSPPPVVDNLFKNLVALQKSQWECDSCLTRNDSEKTKCMCCETVRAESGISSQNSSIASDTLNISSLPVPTADDFFKNLAAKQKSTQWECDVCMCKNDLDKEKCLSCETPKPGSKPVASSKSSLTGSSFKFGMPSVTITDTSTTKPAVATDDLFKSLAAQQKKTRWECDVCMTGNDTSSEKCVACETPKPGSKPAPKSTQNFSFGMQAASTTTTTHNFSFGMPQTTTTTLEDVGFKKLVENQSKNWECTVCMLRNEPLQSKCLSCEHPRPGSSDSQPKFLFGSVMKSSVTLPDPSEVKFKFGVQPQVTKEEESKKNEKDEVDKPKSTFSFGVDASTAKTSTDTSSFTFKTPANNNSIPASTVSASFTLKSPAKSDEKKDEPETDKPGMFSFGAKTDDKKVTFSENVNVLPEIPSRESEKSDGVDNKTEGATPAFGGFKFGNIPGVKPLEEVKNDKETTSGGFAFKSSGNLNFAFGSPKTTSSSSSSLDTKVTSSFGGFSNQSTTAQPSVPVTTTTSSFAFGSTAPAASTFSFGSVNKEAVTSALSSNTKTSTTTNASGGFSFGSENKPASKSGGFSFTAPSTNNNNNSSIPVFGSQSTATQGNSSIQPTNTFSFGSPSSIKSNENKSTFGAFPSAPQQQTPFGNSNIALTTPIFGQAAAASFGGIAANKEPMASSVFAFGSKPSVTPSTQPTTMFGNNAASSTPNNNNESGFGSKMMGFGNSASSAMTNAPHKRAFDFGSAQPDVPHKKFEFGSQQQPQQQQQQQQPQTNSSPFQFNAHQSQMDAVRPAFSFNATAPPAFNFTSGSSNVINNNAQENFQFGATNPSSTPQGIFAFGTNPQQPQSAPPAQLQGMQFGSSTPSIAIPGINAFGPTQTNANNANRKILRAARRTNLQRR